MHQQSPFTRQPRNPSMLVSVNNFLHHDAIEQLVQIQVHQQLDTLIKFTPLWQCHPPVRSFVDREPVRSFVDHEIAEDLTTYINNAFSRNNSSTRFIKLSGLAGVGKTQVSLNVAARLYRQKTVNQVIRIHANMSDMNQFFSQFRFLAKALELNYNNQSELEIVNAVYQELSNRGKTFYIFDDVTNKDQLIKYLPHKYLSCVSLITCQDNTDWGNDFCQYTLGGYKLAEAMKYVYKLLNGSGKFNEEDARALVETLGYYPLSIAQAIFYILQIPNNTTIRKFLGNYNEMFAIYADNPLLPTDRYQKTAWITINLSIEKLMASDKKILTSCSFLHPDVPITRRFLNNLFGHQVDKTSFDALLSYGLLTPCTPDSDDVVVHSIVQRVVRETVANQGDLLQSISLSNMRMHRVGNYNDEDANEFVKLAPHLLSCLTTLPSLPNFQTDSVQTLYADVIEGYADILLTQGQCNIALELIKKSMSIFNRLYGQDSLLFLFANTNLMRMLLCSGHTSEAIVLANQIESIFNKLPIFPIDVRFLLLQVRITESLRDGNTAKCLVLLDEMRRAKASEPTSRHFNTLAQLFNEMFLYFVNGNRNMAFSTGKTALETWHSLHKKPNKLLAHILLFLSELDETTDVYRKELYEILPKLDSSDAFVAIVKCSIAEHLIGSYDLAGAEKLINESMPIIKINLHDSPLYLTSLFILAKLRFVQKKYKTALHLLQSVLIKLNPDYFDHRSLFVVVHSLLSDIHYTKGDYHDCLIELRKLRDIHTILDETSDIPLYLNMLIRMAVIHRYFNEYDEIVKIYVMMKSFIALHDTSGSLLSLIFILCLIIASNLEKHDYFALKNNCKELSYALKKHLQSSNLPEESKAQLSNVYIFFLYLTGIACGHCGMQAEGITYLQECELYMQKNEISDTVKADVFIALGYFYVPTKDLNMIDYYFKNAAKYYEKAGTQDASINMDMMRLTIPNIHFSLPQIMSMLVPGIKLKFSRISLLLLKYLYHNIPQSIFCTPLNFTQLDTPLAKVTIIEPEQITSDDELLLDTVLDELEDGNTPLNAPPVSEWPRTFFPIKRGDSPYEQSSKQTNEM